MLQKRVLPVLLLQKGGLVKTTKFKHPLYIGDPINAVKIFNDKEADELVILDIDAGKTGKGPDYDLLERIAGEAFMPLAYGGAVQNRDQVKRLIRMGFEKIILNTALHTTPGILEELSGEFALSSFVAGVDVKSNLFGKYEVYSHAGTKKVPGQLLDICQRFQAEGAGELLIHSIDRDGTMKGYDLNLVQTVSSHLSIPVIACGGAGKLEHITEAHQKTNAAAFAAGSMFVFHGPHKAVLISYPSYTKLREVLEED
jgi:cyclase